MNAEITTFQLNGWTLARLSDVEDDEPRIPALALGEKLGFAEPKAIRKLIKRMIGEGKLPGVCDRDTVSPSQTPTGGRRDYKTREYFLTEPQAIKVIAKSETPIADQILDEVIDVYVKFRKGLLARPQGFDMQAIATVVATSVVAAMAPMFEKMMELVSTQRSEAATGVIGRDGDGHIRRNLMLYARLMCPGDPKGQKSWRTSAEHEIRGIVGFNGYGRRWPMLPARDFPQVQILLDNLIRRAMKTNEMIEQRHPRQGKLDLDDGDPEGGK